MVFLTPLALLGLLAALVPPLLHLFQRRRPPEVEFPAVRYLRQSEVEARRSIRLRHLLLMALRVLVIVLVVLAAARPVVPGGFGAVHEPTALAIVLDNSLSSGAVIGGQRVFDDLALRARETLRAARAADALWVIGADGLARRGTPEELLEHVAALAPDARRLDLGAAVREAARLVSEAGYARAEVHLLSDLQATALGTGGGAGLGDMPVLVYSPAAEPPPNLGVASALPQPAVWTSAGGAVVVAVGGGPAAPGARGTATLELEGRPVRRALAAPGGSVALAVPSAAPGWRRGIVSLEPDELAADDRRAFAVRVVAPPVVAAEPAAAIGTFAREALAVLAAGGRVRLADQGAVRFGTMPSARGASVVVPPADPIRLGALNRALQAAGVEWRFAERVEREDTVVAAQLPELAGARVAARYRLTAPGGEVPGEVLARVGGEPWLVRHDSMVVVASRLVPEETSLPLTGAFVPFVAALVGRLVRGESGVLVAAPGESVALPGRVTAIRFGDSTQAVERGSVVTAPGSPGVYPLLAGPDTAALLVVEPDPRESNLARADAAALAVALPGARLDLTRDPRAYAARRFRGAGRSELTGWLLVAALLALVAEALAAAGPARRPA